MFCLLAGEGVASPSPISLVLLLVSTSMGEGEPHVMEGEGGGGVSNEELTPPPPDEAGDVLLEPLVALPEVWPPPATLTPTCTRRGRSAAALSYLGLSI